MKKFPVEMKKSPFFEGIEDTEEEKVLKGLDAHEMTYDKENYILHCGEQVKEMGMLVSGGLLIVQEDFWGNRNLVAKIGPGDVFAETFACMQRRNINVNVDCRRSSKCAVAERSEYIGCRWRNGRLETGSASEFIREYGRKESSL